MKLRSFIKWLTGVVVATAIELRMSEPLKAFVAPIQTELREVKGFFKTWIESAKEHGFVVTQTQGFDPADLL